MARKQGSGWQAGQQELETESLHLQMQSSKQGASWTQFKALNLKASVISSSKAVPPNLSQTSPPAGDQVFKGVTLGAISHSDYHT